MKKLTFTKYTFVGKGWNDTESEVCSYGRTPEEAKSHIGRPENYRLVAQEEVPYTHAERAHAIAAALPGEWEATPTSYEHANCAWTLRRADGVAIWFSGPCYNHKAAFQFSADLPRHNGSYVEAYRPGTYDKMPTPRINCGESKTPEQMAKDIARRMLADTEEITQVVRARIASMIAAADAREATLAAVCEAMGKPTPSKDTRYPEYRYKQSVPHGGAEISTGGTVSFTLYGVPKEQALKLAALLATFEKK